MSRYDRGCCLTCGGWGTAGSAPATGGAWPDTWLLARDSHMLWITNRSERC